MRFDLTDLLLFVHVGETATITGAAARSNLAVASASERIRGMEELLGVALLERGRRGVRLTPAGQTLLHHARTVTQQLERMRGELGEYARGLKGHIRLLSNTAGLSEFLPDALAAFLAADKNVNIDIEEKLSQEIIEALMNGLGDIGIVSDVVDLSAVESFPFRLARLVVVMPCSHPLAGRRRVAFREFNNDVFVGLTDGSALQDYLAQHAARAGYLINVRVRLRSFEAICRMVSRGVGVGIVPETAARRCRKSMAISAVRLEDNWALRSLFICVRKLDALPVHAQRLVRHLRESSPAAIKSRRRSA